ncbi:sucrase ferredoxin-like family [Grosmannia clavigera kw1407]|uniref:Sucrase ferredoxin-like family n=1 Tax=Grosmannia clavigera (strain kw1407 / UAMH 11150) TaxID=655863 RepID=F0XLF4_GROCL|nr:sucrase ferredoxin-like family [Grosmannia clavigera kw1407]EFX01092.1 sucrase ferredoxin-like family [Grosmannia clavigera kw1407]
MSAFRSFVDGAKKLAIHGRGAQPAPPDELFVRTDAAVDGDDCLHDCASCTVQYPRGFKIDDNDRLYGLVKGWGAHLLVATGKADWVRDVADEKGSLMEAIDRANAPSHVRLMLSASNMPTPPHQGDHAGHPYGGPTRVLLLPAFVVVDQVGPADVESLLQVVGRAPSNTMSMDVSSAWLSHIPPPLAVRPSPHSVLVLLCSQKTRDARCGQSAPLLRRELERHLRPLGLYRDLDDERPGGVGIYFISHVGGHKYSANVLVYRRPDPFGIDHVQRANLSPAEQDRLPDRIRAAVPAVLRGDKSNTVSENGAENGAEHENGTNQNGTNPESGDTPTPTPTNFPPGAAQCLWLARIRPEDCENLVRYTILQGKVVKPESQLRGGFDRSRGLLSW